MRAEWFRPLVLKQWGDLAWNATDLRRASRLMKAISSENGGRLFIDEELSVERARSYAILRLGLALRSHGNGVSDAARAERVIGQLSNLLDEVRAKPSPAHRYCAATRASTAVRCLDRIERSAAAFDGNTCTFRDVVPLFGRDYLPKALEVIVGSKSSIAVSMFLFRLTERSTYPTRQLADALIEATHRGVETRVLLDKDAEGDLYQTRSINGPAARYLLDHKVTVRERSGANVNHLKCLLSDGRLVLSGSHNWTAGALRRYDELSMFIDSTMLAARFAEKFNALWEKAAPA